MPDAILGPASPDLLEGTSLQRAGPHLNLQALRPEITLADRRVDTRKLELMRIGQLQDDPLRLRGPRHASNHRQPKDQPAARGGANFGT